MSFEILNNDFFIRNRNKLAKSLEINSICILAANRKVILNVDSELKYKVNSNLYYFTGITVPDVIFVLYYNKLKSCFEEVLFIKESSELEKIWGVASISLDEASKISGIQNILYLKDFDKFIASIANSNNIFYLQSHTKYFDETYLRVENNMVDRLKNSFPFHCYKNLSSIIKKIRTLKESEEIEIIKNACKLTSDAYKSLLPKINSLEYEYQIQAELAHYFIGKGLQRFAYEPIVASGLNSCILHYTDNCKKMQPADVILLDFGAEYLNYASDTTRVVPFLTKFNILQRKYYEIVLNTLKHVNEFLVIGKTFAEFSLDLTNYLIEQMLSAELISNKKDNSYKKYFMHNIAHHLGLDTHDDACYDLPLENGMVFAIEPALYLSHYSLGIRLENTYVLNNGGVENLCEDMPIEIEEIEYIMGL